MLSVKDMFDYGFDYTDCKHIGQDDYDCLVNNGCKPLAGDVLIAKDGSFFKKGFVVQEEKDQAVLSSIAIIRPKKEVMNPEFLLKYLLSDKVLSTVSSMTSGTALKRVILKKFKTMKVLVPPISLQDEYVDFLHQVNKSKVIKESVKSRFIEMFDRYEKAPLIEMADITMGQSPDSSTYNDWGIGVPFFQGKSEFTDTFVQINKYCSKPKKITKEMDILMSVRAPVGAVNLTSQKCCIGRGLAAITPKYGIADVWFLFNALRMMEQQISDIGVGSTFAAISKDDMRKIRIPVAPLSIQIQFSDFVRHVDKSKVGVLSTILLINIYTNTEA